MIWWKKKRENGEEIELVRASAKEVRKHRNKTLHALRNLEKWFAVGKVGYVMYLERKKELSLLKGEYIVYLARTKRKIESFRRNRKKEI